MTIKQTKQILHLKKAIDDEQTIVFTDKSTSYVNIAYYVEIHITENHLKKQQKKH